ncbi:hypothetical protein K2X30_09470 [bacterium]|nr:hypothetical protein [bacterium]
MTTQFAKLATHDLHFHYDGSISREVVRAAFSDEIGVKYAKARVERTLINEPVKNPDDFFAIFQQVMKIFNLTDDIQPILEAQLELAARDGLKHLDYRFGCGALNSRFGLSEGSVLDRFQIAVSHANVLGLDVCPTLCFSRHESKDRADHLMNFVLENEEFVRAIDLEGPEGPNTTASFGPIFRKLKDAGLRITIHAGEFSSSESIWQAIDDCGAERIGHGFSAATDSELLRRLAKDQIAVEVCLTSNYLMGLCSDLKSHPFLKFLEAGIPVVLCTDDQAIFQTTLAREYEKADEILRSAKLNSQSILKAISENSRRFAFSEVLV